MKKVVLLVFTSLILISAFSANRAGAAESGGKVDSMKAGFWATRSQGRVDLNTGDDIYEYDILETDSSGTAVVRFADGSVLQIGSDAKINVTEIVFSGDRNRFNVGIMQGAARMITGEIVKRNPNNFKVTTPKSTIGIRGTTLLFEVRTNFEKVTVEEISEGSVVKYTNKDTRESWTMTRPGDTVSVTVSSPTTPTVPTPGVPAPGAPALGVSTTTNVEVQGAGVTRGDRDPSGTDRSGAGDNPRETGPQTNTGGGGGSNNDDKGNDVNGGTGSGGGKSPNDCCNDNSSPGRN
ncbi:MAG: FecR family protein [Synergistaceae bacterium]|jgi:hypothetical protein|nr:FecR family protein [Synergistaceae bacterium]